jgi:hypothetical protein
MAQPEVAPTVLANERRCHVIPCVRPRLEDDKVFIGASFRLAPCFLRPRSAEPSGDLPSVWSVPLLRDSIPWLGARLDR